MTARIGPWGQLIDFACPSAVDISQDQRSSFVTTLGGRVIEQRGLSHRRSWQVGVGVGRPGEMAELEALSSGAFGPPPWTWVSPDAAAQNMMTPGSSLLELDSLWGDSIPMGSRVAVDGTLLPRTVGALSGNWVDFGRRIVGHGTPVKPGDVITGSLYAEGPGTMTLIFRSEDGTWMGGHPEDLTARLERHHATATVPEGAIEAIVRLTSSTGTAVAGAPAITMTHKPMAWTVGKGCAKSTVDGFDTTVLRAVRGADSQSLSRYSFTVRELG